MIRFRSLVLILLLPLFAAPVYAQGNPNEEPCGLPASGTIVETVTYTLKSNCSQTGTLEIRTASTPNVTLTINGMGHTISNGTGADWSMSFLIVDDQGKDTVFNTDTTASPNVKVVIKNVTFDGNGWLFGKHVYQGESGGTTWLYTGGIGSWISTEGELVMENVTFTEGNGSWLRVEGSATLKSVLFEDSKTWSWGITDIVKGSLFVNKTGSVTLNNAVFRDMERTMIVIEKGGSLSTTGCLSFVRTFSHNVYHSGVDSDLYGAWNDSTGACSGDIGNGGKAVVAYSPALLDCGLPEDAVIDEDTVYTLKSNCVCLKRLVVASGAKVTINGNGYEIRGCAGTQYTIGEGRTPRGAAFVVGAEGAHLQITNANIYGVRAMNWGGTFTLGKSMLAQASPTPIQNYGFANVFESLFEDNKGVGNTEGNVYDGYSLFRMGRALFRDNTFRRNTLGETELFTKGGGTEIILCGENEGDNGDEPIFAAADGGTVGFSCPVPKQPAPTPVPLITGCQTKWPHPPQRMSMGVNGAVFFVQLCPPVIDIWEILPDGQGQFALRASQADIELVAEGTVACSTNGRAVVQIGLTEPVRQHIVYSRAYQPPSVRGGRDILISVGPDHEGKVNHIVFDRSLDGPVLGTLDTHSYSPPCSPHSVARVAAPPAAAPTPEPVRYAAAVAAQAAQADGSIVHVVQPGDTVWQIGVAYGVHPHAIILHNQLHTLSNRGGYIYPGQELAIPQAE